MYVLFVLLSNIYAVTDEMNTGKSF